MGDACHFDRLPPEMLLQVFGLLSTKELMGTVRLVCKRFNSLLTNKQWWITRLQKERQVHVSEAEASCDTFNAPQSFEDSLREERRWKQFRHSDLKVADGHISTVDAIRIFRRGDRRFCLSGSRDRSMKLWDINKIQEDAPVKEWEVVAKENAHTGWIWYIDNPIDDQFLSSGWDDFVKMWKIRPEEMMITDSCKLPSAITSAQVMECGLAACSTFKDLICFVDVAEGLKVVNTVNFHRGPVFTMDIDGNYVYSGGDDKKFIISDVRNLSKPILSMKTSQDSVQSISVNHGQVVCGTSKGSVKIYNPTTMSLISSYKPGANVRIRQVRHNRGSVIAMCRTQLVKIFTAGTRATVRAETREVGEPSRFDYLKGDFAICGGMGNIMFWPCPEGIGY